MCYMLQTDRVAFTCRSRLPVNYTTGIGGLTPNTDTLYSFGYLDLSTGPLTITVPDTNGDFYGE